MAFQIADTSSVDPRARLADDVIVGPYCVIGPSVQVGTGTRLISHVAINGQTILGARNVIHPFVVLGTDPAGQPVPGERGQLVVGDENLIREHVSIAASHGPGEGWTRLGSRNVLMPGVQIGPGTALEDRITVGNNTVIAEEVRVGPHVVISPAATVQRRVTLGPSSCLGPRTKVQHDVPPYFLVDGEPARVRGVHLVGLKRRGVGKPAANALREAYRLLYRARMDIDAVAEVLASHNHRTPEVDELIAFLHAQRAGRHGRALESCGDGRRVLPGGHEREAS